MSGAEPAWNCSQQTEQENQGTEQTAQLLREFFSHFPNLFLFFLYYILLFFQKIKLANCKNKFSQLPVFRSNLSNPDYPELGDRILVQIDDPRNRIDFYAVYRKDQKKQVTPFLELLSKKGPN